MVHGVPLSDPSANLPQVAGYYSQLAGVLAGFSFAGLIALLTTQQRASRLTGRQFRSIGPLIGAFMGLVASSLDYALVAGEQVGTARVASLQTTAGLGFSVAGIMLIYSLLVLMSDLQTNALTRGGIGTDTMNLLRNLLVVVLPPLLVLLMWSGMTDHLGQKYGAGPLFRHGLNQLAGAVLVVATTIVIIYRIVLFRSPREQRRLPGFLTGSAVVLAFASLIGSALQITIMPSNRSVTDAIPATALILVAAFSLLASYSASRYPPASEPGPQPAARRNSSPTVAQAAPVTLLAPAATATAAAPNTTEQERLRQIHAGILEPLDRDILVRRSVDIFPQGYLMNISIIQGVALAAIVSESTKFLRDAPVHLFVPALAQSLLNLAALIVVSYEYLWFTTIVRWAPTFRDTAIPIVLGVSEIAPAYLIDRPVAWWLAFAAFALLGAGAFGNTVLRLRPELFSGRVASYHAVRRLLVRLLLLCATTVGTGLVVARLLTGVSATAAIGISTASAVVVLTVAAAMIGYSERVLNDVYHDFGIGRRPQLFQHWHDRRRGVAVPFAVPADDAGQVSP